MKEEIIDKANEIILLIKKNEKAIEVLERFSQSGVKLWLCENKYGYFSASCPFQDGADFEGWEIQLMIHQKKQRLQALKKQLENL